MKKLLLLLLLPITVFATEVEDYDFTLQSEVQKEIEIEIKQEIADSLDEVKIWMDLYKAVEAQYIDIESYPNELGGYMIHQTKIIEKYLTLVEEAETLYYDGGDYKGKIVEAKKVLLNLKLIRKIFDEYVEYKITEKSQNFLKMTEEAIRNKTVIPRMSIAAYTVLRGEYPVKAELLKSTSRIKSLRRHVLTYANDDEVTFLRDKLISIETNDTIEGN